MKFFVGFVDGDDGLYTWGLLDEFTRRSVVLLYLGAGNKKGVRWWECVL